MSRAQLLLYQSSVQAVFPSPADDYIESHLDLQLLIDNQTTPKKANQTPLTTLYNAMD